jgi:hypothetical protein
MSAGNSVNVSGGEEPKVSVLSSERKIDPPFAPSPLGDDERTLYAVALDHSAPLSVEELRRLSGLCRTDVDTALRRLLGLGLLSVDAESGRLAAVSPVVNSRPLRTFA